MNKLIFNNANMIKQPGQCCVHCGKSYKKKTILEKHVILCELLTKTKKGIIIEQEDDIPSQHKIYNILLELGVKFNQLEEKVDELNKWVVKKKKKINVVEWLNANIINHHTAFNGQSIQFFHTSLSDNARKRLIHLGITCKFQLEYRCRPFSTERLSGSIFRRWLLLGYRTYLLIGSWCSHS
jgi:hypothetical protein